MRILNFSAVFISKLKQGHIISLYKKITFSQYKNCTLQASFFSSTSRYFAAINSSSIDFLSRKKRKRYREIENEYAHQVMEKLPSYSSSLLKWPLQREKHGVTIGEPGTHSDIVDRFAQITLHNVTEGLSLEQANFTDVVQKICIALPEASDDDIKEILYYFSMWPSASSTKARNFKKLWNSLDEECVRRMKSWNVNQKLLIGDIWFHLKLSRITHYNSELISNLIKDIESLANHEVVQLMFYINLQRRIPDNFVLNLEKKLESVIDVLTLEEVGIICLGFFKTQNKISNLSLIQSIIKKFMHDVENVNTVTVAAILKFLRKSLNSSLTDSYILILHKCVSCLNNFDIPTSVHAALLSAECNVYHPLLLNLISEKLAHEMANIRIKDCAKLLLCLSTYNHMVGNFHSLFISELKKENRQDENYMHPQHLVHSILYYSYMGKYDYDLLSQVLEEKFVETCCFNSPEMLPNFVEIDYCVEIECPDYKGPRLDASKRKELDYRRGNIPTKSHFQNMQTRLINDVYETILEIFGSDENVVIRHVLPHMYSPDIIVRLSGNTEKSLASICQAVPSECILKPPRNEVWAALVVCGTYSFAYKSTHMTAIPIMKMRQLQKIGYFVTSIPYFCVSRNTTKRKKIIEEKLNILEQQKSVISK